MPTDDSLVGPSARAAEPCFEQVFIGAGGGIAGADAALRFERKLYVIRKRVEKAVETLKINALAKRTFYIVSLSSQTLIYKGMLTAQQLRPMFPDLSDPRLESALALVHQRFSTNTFPSWPLAHPYRLIAHNGEINTLRGNINWMRAREGLLKSQVLGDDLKKVLPVIREGGSDTATFDNVLELLVMAGRSLPHAVLMMIPEPWSGNDLMAARPQGVLRVPLVADGAVGRPGVDRVHRRHGDRRGARPQRPAAVALLRHQGRPGGDGLGSGRAGRSRPRTCSRRGGSAPGASSWSTRRRAASSATTRSSASWPPSGRTGSGSTSTWSTSSRCRRRAPRSRSRRRSSPGSSRSATRRRTCGS